MKNRIRLSTMKLTIGGALLMYIGYMLSQHASQTWPPPDSNVPILDIRDGPTPLSNPVLTRVDACTSTFESTMRNCLTPKCFNGKVPLLDGSSIHRVGLLAPLNSGGEHISKFLQKLMEKSVLPEAIDLTYETHVPPYGYGKNHGWSSIIRLSRKVIPHALSLAVGLNLDEAGLNFRVSRPGGILAAAVDIQTRQLVRWHCRLSHVAAHTKLLTVYVEDFLERPEVVLDSILAFIGFKPSQPDFLAALPDLVLQIKKSLSFPAAEYQMALNSTSSSNRGDMFVIGDGPSKLLKIPEEFLHASASAVTNEIILTDGLSRWPCESFRKIKTEGLSTAQYSLLTEKLRMSPPMLAANCSNPFVKCSVRFDFAGG